MRLENEIRDETGCMARPEPILMAQVEFHNRNHPIFNSLQTFHRLKVQGR